MKLNLGIQEALLKKFGIEHASLEAKQELLTSLDTLTYQVTLDTILEHLSNDEGRTFLKLLEADETGEKALLLAKERIPDLEQKIEKSMNEEMEQLRSVQ